MILIHRMVTLIRCIATTIHRMVTVMFSVLKTCELNQDKLIHYHLLHLSIIMNNFILFFSLLCVELESIQ